MSCAASRISLHEVPATRLDVGTIAKQKLGLFFAVNCKGSTLSWHPVYKLQVPEGLVEQIELVAACLNSPLYTPRMLFCESTLCRLPKLPLVLTTQHIQGEAGADPVVCPGACVSSSVGIDV